MSADIHLRFELVHRKHFFDIGIVKEQKPYRLLPRLEPTACPTCSDKHRIFTPENCTAADKSATGRTHEIYVVRDDISVTVSILPV